MTDGQIKLGRGSIGATERCRDSPLSEDPVQHDKQQEEATIVEAFE